jgi:hypothetical protein
VARRGSREGVAPEKKGEREGADRWGQAEGMTEKGKERLRKERNDWERKGITEKIRND